MKKRYHFYSQTAIACLAAFLLTLGGFSTAQASTDEESIVSQKIQLEENTVASETINGTAEDGIETEPAIPLPTEEVTLTSCILSDGTHIIIEGTLAGTVSDPEYYDNYLYLFELKPYEASLEDRSDYLAQIGKEEAISFTLPRTSDTSEDRMYSRFTMAVFDGEAYVPVSNEVYVTNPESVATHTAPYETAQSKKGLLIETSDACVTDAFNLGVNHVIVNIPFQQLFGSGIDYTYEGKNYHFNKGLISRLDNNIRKMSSKNMTITAVLLNGWNPATPQLFYPGLKKQSGTTALYYGFHTATKESADTLRAAATFLAERYGSPSSSNGKISNWIIGNEINNQQWNYIGPMNMASYLKEYERAFRLFYTAIRSVNANDRIYFSTDYNWNREADGITTYNAKDVICEFAKMTRESGNIDWGLAYHPYSYPMTEPEFWDDDQTGLVTEEITSPIVNMKNLHVLTDMMQENELLDSNGQVRHIILSEQGFTSKSATRGEQEELQAAAIAYAYYIADSNPYIDAFIMNRQVDAPIEADASLELGLWHYDKSKVPDIVPTTKKKSWNVYKNITKKGTTLEVTRFAKEILGIQKWSDVIPNFRWKAYE